MIDLNNANELLYNIQRKNFLVSKDENITKKLVFVGAQITKLFNDNRNEVVDCIKACESYSKGEITQKELLDFGNKANVITSFPFEAPIYAKYATNLSYGGLTFSPYFDIKDMFWIHHSNETKEQLKLLCNNAATIIKQYFTIEEIL